MKISKRPYKAGRAIRDYDSGILLAPKPFEDMEYILITIVVAFLLAVMIFIDSFFSKNVFFVLAGFAICVLMLAFTAHRAFTLLKRRKIEADGGYFTTEQGYKSYKRSRSYAIIIAIVGTVVLTAVSVVAGVFGIERFVETSISYIFPLYFVSLSTTLLNSANGGGAVAFVIFRDNRFTAAGYEVSYEGLTVTRRETVIDPAAKYVNAVFWKDGREVGHDTLCREDYLYLSDILDAFGKYAVSR